MNDAHKALNKLVGMDSVKQQIQMIEQNAFIQSERINAGLPADKDRNHLILEGPPGVGKTTIAKQIGRIYYAAGLVDNNKYVEKTGRQLVSPFKAGTTELVDKLFEKHKGGVIFVDEVYTMLPTKGQEEYGMEALNQLMFNAEKYKDNTVVILAGYDDTVLENLNRFNPGMNRRFPNLVKIPPYSKKELGEIALVHINRQPADAAAEKQLRAYAGLVPDNAGGVQNFDAMVRKMQARRLGKSPNPEDLDFYTADDVKAAAKELGLVKPRSKR